MLWFDVLSFRGSYPLLKQVRMYSSLAHFETSVIQHESMLEHFTYDRSCLFGYEWPKKYGVNATCSIGFFISVHISQQIEMFGTIEAVHEFACALFFGAWLPRNGFCCQIIYLLIKHLRSASRRKHTLLFETFALFPHGTSVIHVKFSIQSVFAWLFARLFVFSWLFSLFFCLFSSFLHFIVYFPVFAHVLSLFPLFSSLFACFIHGVSRLFSLFSPRCSSSTKWSLLFYLGSSLYI